MWETITIFAGIASTILAWQLNPKRRLYTEIDSIYKRLEELYVRRDKALADNDSDILTIVTLEITQLKSRKIDLLKRL